MEEKEDPTPATLSDTPRTVEIDDLYRFRLISDPRISPDGKVIAYVQTRARKKKNDYASNIWLVSVDGHGAARRFTGGDKRDMSPRWSPKGDELAFLTDRSGKNQIWIIPYDGGEAMQITRSKHGVGEFAWSADGEWLAFTQPVDNDRDKEERQESVEAAPSGEAENREAGDAGEEGFGATLLAAREWEEDLDDEQEPERKRELDHARVITRVNYKADGRGFLERRTHIFLVSRNGNHVLQLTEGDWDAGMPRWSPDGQTLAFLCNQAPEADYENIQDIYVVPLSDKTKPGAMRQVTGHNSAIANFDWLPSGDGFAAFAHSRVEEVALGTNLEVWTISLEGEVQKLTERLDRSVGNWVNSDLRSGGGEIMPRFSADGGSIFFQATDGGAVHIFSVLVVGGEIKRLVGGERQIYAFDVSEAGIIFAATSVTDPNSLFFADTAGEEEIVLLNPDRDVLDGLKVSGRQAFRVERPDGARIEAWMLLPPDFDEAQRYPLILQIHGGPHTAYGEAYFHEFQVLAAQGYLVLYTNPRGSQGYGQEFGDAIINDWGGVDYDDLMSCVDYAVELPYVDGARLGVAGGSYGGYMTAWVIGHTGRFRAAVAMRAVTNLYSAWGNGDFTWRLWSWELRGTPQERTALYLERSPITHVANIYTPLLLTHAQDDLRVNVEQSEQLYTALRVLRRKVKMVLFPSGGHDISRTGKPSLRAERLRHIADWFDEHLASDN